MLMITKFIYKVTATKAATGDVLQKVFLKICNIYKKTPVPEFLFS